MTKALDRSLTRVFRLTNESGGLGLSCTPAGLSLAGVPLLYQTQAGLVPRPASEIASLLNAAYGDQPTVLQSRLGAIAQSLNCGDFAMAMIAAVHTRTLELSPEAAIRLAKAEQELTKYNFNPDEPRDWRGRWTTDGTADQTGPLVPDIASEQADDGSPGTVDIAARDDIMRSIVKNACIAECSESSLPTHDYGWKFVKCINECMSRHGYDPHSVRL
jgi:hypothetical protein